MHGIRLNGTAENATDPQNAANEVIRITTGPAFSQNWVARCLDSSLAELDNMLDVKSYYAAPKTCTNTPSMMLLVDADGDGDYEQFPASPDFAAFGAINPPTSAACVPDVWRFDDLTDDLPRWGASPEGAVAQVPTFPVQPWSAWEAAITRVFPRHHVFIGFLYDVNYGAPGQQGVAYYDLLSIGNKTWSDWTDTAGRDDKGKFCPVASKNIGAAEN